MDHQDHVALIAGGIVAGGVWADLGSGRGAFTLALAECLGTESMIYSVDVDRRALEAQKTRMGVQYPDNEVHYIQGDFTKSLELPKLDGIIMANSLHFIHEKIPVLQHIQVMLKAGGHLILVEYDTDEPTLYVPHPISFSRWVQLATETGFQETKQLAIRPSSTMGRIYSAISTIT